jgi:hypothetical protein
MNPLENYKAVLDQYFGPKAATFDVSAGTTNHVIGALNHTQFGSFRASFLERLRRLSSIYKPGSVQSAKLLPTLNEVASERNWEGAYSELVALDFMNSDTNWSSDPIELSLDVPAANTLTGGLGNKVTNYDGYFRELDVFFDVKVLLDKSRDILDGVIGEAKETLGGPPVDIAAEYPLDEDFSVFEKNRPKLLKELVATIDLHSKLHSIQSAVVPQLTYKLIWKPGTLMTVSSYNPYVHAENHHQLLFKHAKKFSRTAPSLIVFVVFPWFSEKPSMADDGSTFYRAFARRFFCQYLKDTMPANTLLNSFKGPETVGDITRQLSGVLFLEDKSITATNPLAQNVNSFAYLNPNAAHKLGRHFRHHLEALHVHVEDFEGDNY